MKSVFIIFPHQLFKDVALLTNKEVYIIEEYLFFKQYNFHQQKIIFHRATMQYYYAYLQSKKVKVTYINSTDAESDVQVFINIMAKKSIAEIEYYDVVDNWLEKRIQQSTELNKIKITQYSSQLFINDTNSLENYFGSKKKYFQIDFYKQQRKQQNILLNNDGSPMGDKWTFDTENRLKYPKGKIAPSTTILPENVYVKEAKLYVATNYANNLGNSSSTITFATTHQEAKDWLNEFLTKRFNEFGVYEDAIVANEIILHHSVLTPMLNVGLITPKYIISTVLEYTAQYNIAINNTEGFIRQVIGWREFIRGVYIYQGSKERTTNYWNFTKKIPTSFYNGTTGIVPVDDTIKKVLQTGYCHHIERLMILGNFMLLCEFDPNEVYRWFMELFIDAYDWVMVPNVYGMSQFADGGLMATKPYISGSNYIIKMSNYKKTNEENGWDVIWDGLFWRFMDKQRSFFLQNPRLGMLVNMFDKMPEEKRKKHIDIAEKFLVQL